MSDTDEKILKALEQLQANVTDLQAGQQMLQADASGLKNDLMTVKDVQHKQGKQLEALETGQNALELKIEAIHSYQKQAHHEIMDSLFDSNEITGKTQQALEKRIDRIEKHLGLPPLK